jgi:hypothetical protein
MQVIMTAYSMYANKKYRHIGHLFQGRFGSIIVEKETYFLQVLRYIHLNPVKAGLAASPEEYPWSSYRQYLGDTGKNLPYLEISEVLPMFSLEKSRQAILFRDFTLAGLTEDFDPTKTQVRGILGSLSYHQYLNRVLRQGRL